MDILLEGGTIVTMDPRRRVISASVLVGEGRIKAIGDGLVPSKHGATRRIDCSGRLIIPGLIQSHVHLCQTLFRGQADGRSLLEWLRERIWPLEGAHTYESMRASARLGIAELIRGGTTACMDMATVRHTDAVFEVAAEAGFRLTSGKAMMDKSRGLPKQLRESTRDSLQESDALLERWHGSRAGLLRYAYAPRFALSCTEKLLEEVAARSIDRKVQIHTHASENPDELKAVRRRFRMDNVDYLDHIGISGPNVALAHCVWLTQREERLMADSGTHLLHCPSSNLKLGSGIAKVPELLGMGVCVSLGADGAPCNNNLDMWTEMRLASLIHLPRVGPKGLEAEQVFEMATLGGARAMGLEHEIGSIEEGKRADLVILNVRSPHIVPAGDDVYSRLVYAGKSSDVESVLIDGEVVLDRGVLTTIDLGEVLSEAEEQAALLARLL